jgi:hypothetical protein
LRWLQRVDTQRCQTATPENAKMKSEQLHILKCAIF